jgi:DNA-binding response OmpR family regulator
MMARERAILTVLRTVALPVRKAEWLKFCDLVRAADPADAGESAARMVVAGGERRVLSPTLWALFEALYAGRGHPISREFLIKAARASALREHVRQARRVLAGSRYRIETHRGIGYQLTVAQD